MSPITNSILRKFAGVMLISIFTCTMTPAVIFHDILTRHVDADIQHNHTHQNEYAKAGYNCHTQGFIAEQTFAASATSFQVHQPLPLSPLFSEVVHTFFSQHHFYAELRGPPAAPALS